MTQQDFKLTRNVAAQVCEPQQRGRLPQAPRAEQHQLHQIIHHVRRQGLHGSPQQGRALPCNSNKTFLGLTGSKQTLLS